MKRTELRPKEFDPVTGERRFSTFKRATAPTLERGAPMKRKAMKRKARRARPGDDPKYKAWIKTQPCAVGGKRCGRVDPHHLIDGKGADRKGMGQTAHDRTLLPLCRRHHDEFHDRRGFSRGWDDARRLTFQEDEAFRLRAIWADLQELGVLQEPPRIAI